MRMEDFFSRADSGGGRAGSRRGAHQAHGGLLAWLARRAGATGTCCASFWYENPQDLCP